VAQTPKHTSFSAMDYQECKIVIILVLTLPQVLLLCSSQDAGLIGLIEFTPPDAKLLRSQAEESGRRDGAEHWQRDAHQQCCYYSADPCQEGLAAYSFCAMGRDGTRCSPQY